MHAMQIRRNLGRGTNTSCQTSGTNSHFRFLVDTVGSTPLCHTPNILSEDASRAHPKHIVWDVIVFNKVTTTALYKMQ
jgi:hypothetical protein